MSELRYVNAPLYVGLVYSDCLFESICLALHLNRHLFMADLT